MIREAVFPLSLTNDVRNYFWRESQKKRGNLRPHEERKRTGDWKCEELLGKI